MNDVIIELLPYKKPFLFVDNILSVDENNIKGTYQLKKDEYFYQGHFPEYPITPGVIITEIMAQIGLVSLGIYLTIQENKSKEQIFPVFTSANINFLSPAYPEDRLIVESQKIYFRFNKLMCDVKCYNENTGKLVGRGKLSGIIINRNDEQR
jgi:3-hydroxyacyl-[acyl-carrier-protein] dehydratase